MGGTALDYLLHTPDLLGFPDGSVSKESACNAEDAGDVGLISGSGRSPEGRMETHSSFLAWKIPWTEEPGGLYSPWGHKESDTTEYVRWLSRIYLEENQFFKKLVFFLRIIIMFVWILLKSNTIVTVTILQILFLNYPD